MERNCDNCLTGITGFCRKDMTSVCDGFQSIKVQFPRIESETKTYVDYTDDDGNKRKICILSARCSACDGYFEQVNMIPEYITYKHCPHCGLEFEDKTI